MRPQRFASTISRTFALAILTLTTVLGAHATELTPDCDQWEVIDTLWITSNSENLWMVDDDGEAEWLVVVVRSSDGDTAMTINPESFRPSGICTGLNQMPLPALFDNITMESIRQAIDRGAISTSTDVMNPVHMNLYIPTCLQVMGSGPMTSYLNLDGCTQGIRKMKYSTPPGQFQASITATAGTTGCTGGEATIEEGIRVE